MTTAELHELAKLEARLFGLDGSGDGGAIGAIIERIDHLEARFNRWAGAVAVVSFVLGFIGFGGVVVIAQHWTP